MQPNSQDYLKDSLERLEHDVESPVVPGELERWLASAAAALGEVKAAFHQQIRRVHQGHFDTIGAEDSGLLSRVEKMQKEDEAISQDVKQLTAEIEKLVEVSESQQWDELPVMSRLESFIQDTIELVIRIRKQEAALETWHGEALQRDRGFAD